MSKKFYLMVATLLVSSVVLSGCIPGLKKEEKPEGDNPEVVMMDSKDGSFTGNLKGLIGLGKAQKCTWHGEEGISGVVYTDGTRSRFEASGIPVANFGQEDDGVGSMYGINDEEYLYTWSSASEEGMKILNDQDEMEEGEMKDDYDNEDDEEAEMEYNRMADYDYDYVCEGWTVDESVFTPPSDIHFRDLSKMMEDMKTSLQGMDKVCDMLEGTEKAECLEGFSNIAE